MNQADDIGVIVEQRAERAVKDAAARNGARLVVGVLLDVEQSVEMYSFLLIDRYGLLGVDVQVRPGARLTGSSGAKRWRSAAPGTKPESISNPLDARNRRLETLRTVLSACGRSMAPDYYSDLAVMAGADLSKVELTPLERTVVVGSDEIGATIDARYNFPPNPGLLDPGEINDLESLITTLNRIDDPEAVARHEDQEAASARLRGRIGGGAGDVRTVAISNSAAGTAPVAIRVAENRYPGAGRPHQTDRTPKSTSPVAYFALAAVLALLVWLVGFDGYATAVTAVRGLVSANSSEPIEAPTASTDEGLGNAKQVFQESDPETWAHVVNPDSPLVNSADTYRLYTWEYTRPDGASGTITLTFDASGMLRGVNRQ